MSLFENELNERQFEAVTAPDGPLLVVAAAGTGKTRTLTYRMAWLVKERQIMPHNILLLTFTNRAAREMLQRAEGLIGGGESGAWGGTFHHVATRILRRHAECLGYSNRFTILDQDDSNRLIKTCMAELGFKPSKPGGKKQLLQEWSNPSAAKAETWKEKLIPKPEVLSSLFGLASSREMPLREVAEERFADLPVDVDIILATHERYTLRKLEQDAMDFDDLLTQALRVLRELPATAAYYQSLFRYILVDEFQDTNHVQSEFVNLLAAGARNLMAVGDDFQSIYSWRGADVRNILDFKTVYPDALEIILEENYRSSPGILEVANCVVAEARGQIVKQLRPTRRGGETPRLARLSNGSHQARFVVQQIRECMEEGIPPSDIAVLYRSHFLSMELQMELTRERLPFTVLSGVRFFEQRHIKDVCTLPLLLANPRDGLAFTRLVELLPGVGEKKARGVWQKINGRAELRSAEGRNAIAEALPSPAKPVWEGFWKRMFAAVENEADLWEKPDVLMDAFQKGFYSDLAAVVYENAQERLQDINELVLYASRFQDAADFLSEMALMTNLEADQDRYATLSSDTVRLSTVHQAKGLEWKVVFVVWLTEGSFPSSKSMEESLSDAEERRLFYVAVTRAKDRLCLCVPRTRTSRSGETTVCEESRFVHEIPEDLLEEASTFRTQFPTQSRWPAARRPRYF